MARTATFIGPRLKRLRRELGLTQANMAADLDISPSYVALIERNQRPVTADLLLTLARTYRVDLAYLADGGQEEMGARLKAVLREPIFADIDLPPLDIADIAASYPGFGEALLRLHTAYSEEQMALAERREQGAAAGGESALDPVTQARNFLAARRNCFPALDESAASVAAEAASSEALVERLKARHAISVRFVDPEVILGALRWHDQHRQRLYVSQLLDHPARRFQLALQVALLEASDQIDRVMSDGRLETDNARRLTRRALANYWAAAFMMPYRPFLRAARKSRHDIEALSREFGASFEQVAHRLTTLQQPGEEGVPFFFLRLDRAGNVSKRLDGGGFPLARHGGACPLWNVHETFERPGQVLAQRLELPDGQRFISVARTVRAGGGSYNAPSALRSVALTCPDEFAPHLVYADGLAQAQPTPIGVACHLCHRPRCIARSAPPIGREIRGDDYRETAAPFSFADD
jgi:predicted transcriptional regulator/transcriptional regulator with XRE-family HTH domain